MNPKNMTNDTLAMNIKLCNNLLVNPVINTVDERVMIWNKREEYENELYSRKTS